MASHDNLNVIVSMITKFDTCINTILFPSNLIHDIVSPIISKSVMLLLLHSYITFSLTHRL